jgi:hypothetical protein
MDIKRCLNKIKMQQLLMIIQRYGLNPKYKNPQKRKKAIKKTLLRYWKYEKRESCSICFEDIRFDNMIITPCSHFFCDMCLFSHIKLSETCPICRSYCSHIYVVERITRERLGFFIEFPKTEEVIQNEIIYQQRYILHMHFFLTHSLSITMFCINIMFMIFFINTISYFITDLANSYVEQYYLYNIYEIMFE